VTNRKVHSTIRPNHFGFFYETMWRPKNILVFLRYDVSFAETSPVSDYPSFCLELTVGFGLWYEWWPLKLRLTVKEI
jgi:hypothetical protein